MRRKLPDQLEQGRLVHGHYRTKFGDLHGAFNIIGPNGRELTIMSSGTGPGVGGWEHVSVSTTSRTPNWTEMCFVKDLFWSEEECVVQYHPALGNYINCHPHCLHLWRPLNAEIPIPPSHFVGPKERCDD
jgi:hypothetical protein